MEQLVVLISLSFLAEHQPSTEGKRGEGGARHSAFGFFAFNSRSFSWRFLLSPRHRISFVAGFGFLYFIHARIGKSGETMVRTQ